MNSEELITNLKSQINNLLEMLAENISAMIRSCENKDSRMTALRNSSATIETLKKVYKMAKEKEDYETCEVVVEFLNEKGIEIS
jgi:hypothetical protein